MGLQLSGSVQLEGNLLVTGSVNSVFENVLVTGTLVAQEIETQLVSSSIIYSSGSNKFGDLITDTQQFTGSINLSGSFIVGDPDNGQGRILFDRATNTTRIQSSKDGTDSVGLSFWTQATGGGFAERMVISGSSIGIGINPTEKFDVNAGQGARGGMALTGEYPYLKFNVSSSVATARSWALSATNLEAGDFAIRQSTAKDGDPVNAGTSILYLSRAGDATFASNLTVEGNTTNFAGGGAYTKSNIDNVLDSGTISISTNPGGGGYAGFLIVSSTNTSNANVFTMTTFSVLGRGTTATFSQIQTLNGPSGGSSFSTSVPSNGSLTVTNTSGGTRSIRMLYTGHNTA